VTPQPGCYGVVDLPGFFPWMIRLFTRSKYSHAFVYLGFGLILEAQPNGSRISPLSRYDGLAMRFSEPAPGYTPDPDAQTAQARWLGIPYGFADIGWLGIDLTTGWRWRWLLDRVRDTRRMICSQLVAAWGAAHGADWSCGQAFAQEVTPGMLAARLG
jgi:hypothetical protein